MPINETLSQCLASNKVKLDSIPLIPDKKAFNKLPDTIRIGPNVCLCSIRYIQEVFHMSAKGARFFLRNLLIPIIYIGHQKYFNLHSFRDSLYLILHPGGFDFFAPCSAPALHPDKYPTAIHKLKPEDLQKLEVLTHNWDIEVLGEVLNKANLRRAANAIDKRMKLTTSDAVAKLRQQARMANEKNP